MPNYCKMEVRRWKFDDIKFQIILLRSHPMKLRDMLGINITHLKFKAV